MIVLAFDTATPNTVVGLDRGDGVVAEAAHVPQPGERPGHASELLRLAVGLLGDAGLTLADVERIGVGVGPGTFTGLRIGVATGRALAQASGAQLVAVPTLTALAAGAVVSGHPGGVLAVLDARRKEAFAAAHDAAGVPLAAPVAIDPERLGELLGRPGPWLAVGDGAIRFREMLHAAGADTPPDESELHRVGAAALCRLTHAGDVIDRDALVPDYVRAPDATVRKA